VPVPPGSGWPGDLANRLTPVAHDRADVVRLAGTAPGLDHLDGRVSVCRACPRLVAWREQVAEDKRASYADERYWGRPISGWGPVRARVAVVGLAPAAHGGNRTGRIFTGDRSGDWLFAAMHRAGLASRPTSERAGDGLRLLDARVLAAVRCAPPANKPTTEERDTCRPWMVRELSLLTPALRCIVVLGGFAWTALWPALAAAGFPPPAAKPTFGHGVTVELGPAGPLVIGCYHPSQQNTFTGRLTEQMLDDVFRTATAYAGLSRTSPPG